MLLSDTASVIAETSIARRHKGDRLFHLAAVVSGPRHILLMLLLQQMQVAQSLHIPPFSSLLLELRLLVTFQEYAIVQVLKHVTYNT